LNNRRRAKLREAVGMLETASEIVSDMAVEEEDYAENMPENMQDGEKYERAMEVVDILNDAVEMINESAEKIEEAL